MLHAIRNNFRNIRNVLSEGIDTDGGYLVPEEYDSRLIEGLEEENIFWLFRFRPERNSVWIFMCSSHFHNFV